MNIGEFFNFILTPDEAEHTPSRADGIDAATEETLRHWGCELIQEAGICTKLPQVVMARAQVLFHRFYFRKSFARVSVKDVAMAVLFLACKLEECVKKSRQVLLVFHRLLQRREGVTSDFKIMNVGSQEYFNMKTALISTEQKVLRELGFLLHVEHPHKFILLFCRMLEGPDEAQNKKFAQTSWNIVNDSLRTTLCVRFPPEAVACGAIALAARSCGVALPESPPWWNVFETSTEDLVQICNTLLHLYSLPKPHFPEIPNIKDKEDEFGSDSSPLPATTPSTPTAAAPPPRSPATVAPPPPPFLVPAGNTPQTPATATKTDPAQANSENKAVGQTTKEKDAEDKGKEKEKEKDKDKDKDKEKDKKRDGEKKKDKERDRAKSREKDRSRKRRSRSPSSSSSTRSRRREKKSRREREKRGDPKRDEKGRSRHASRDGEKRKRESRDADRRKKR